MKAIIGSSLAATLILAVCQVSATPSRSTGTPPRPTETPSPAPAPTPAAGDELIGEYKYSSGSGPNDILLSVTIARESGELIFSLSAAHPDAHGAAPDGSGLANIGPDGTLRFSYTDSFENKGTGTFKRTARGYALSIHIDKVNDARCLPFYGDFILQPVHKRKRLSG